MMHQGRRASLTNHGRAVFDRFKAGREGTVWYYSKLAAIFADRMPGPLSRELDRAVGEMQEL